MIYFNQKFIRFFNGLRQNNRKEWFDQHRTEYIKEVKEPFERFVGDFLLAVNPEWKVTAKECIFRINRDVRFSKDKAPYKTHMGAVIGSEGKKGMTGSVMYVEINDEHVRLYGGLYMIDRDKLDRLRWYIADHLGKFKQIISDKNFIKVFTRIIGEKNKRLNKELMAAAESQPLIFNKQFYFFKEYQPEIITRAGLIDRFLRDYESARDLNKFLEEGIAYDKKRK